MKHSISLTKCQIDELVVEFTLVPTEIHSYACNCFLNYIPQHSCIVLYCIYCIVLYFKLYKYRSAGVKIAQ